MVPELTIRELEVNDISLIADYWINSTDEHLVSMGVDLAKVPKKEELETILGHQLSLPIRERNSFAVIWELNGKPIGHCNTNPTKFCEEANMHLHIWSEENRRKKLGVQLLKMTIPLFFERLKLKQLLCEPYALNPAPNGALRKLGFTFEREYTTIPGSINFKQPVKRWVMDAETASELF